MFFADALSSTSIKRNAAVLMQIGSEFIKIAIGVVKEQ